MTGLVVAAVLFGVLAVLFGASGSGIRRRRSWSAGDSSGAWGGSSDGGWGGSDGGGGGWGGDCGGGGGGGDGGGCGGGS